MSHNKLNINQRLLNILSQYWPGGEEWWESAFKMDPSAGRKNGQWVHFGKYTRWLLKQLQHSSVEKRARLITEDRLKIYNELNAHLQIFKQLEPEERDINKCQDFTHLWQLLNKYRQKPSPTINYTQLLGKLGVHVVYDQEFKIIVPLCNEAATRLSYGTRWCTSHKRYFNYYAEQGPLYIIISGDGKRKFQCHFSSNQYMNEADSHVSWNEIEKINPGAKKICQDWTKEYQKYFTEWKNYKQWSEIIRDGQDLELHPHIEIVEIEKALNYALAHHNIAINISIWLKDQQTINNINQIIRALKPVKNLATLKIKGTTETIEQLLEIGICSEPDQPKIELIAEENSIYQLFQRGQTLFSQLN